MKTAVFSHFSAVFCAEKVLMWLLVQTSSLESNVRLPEIRVQLSTPRSGMLEIPNSTCNIWKLEVDFHLLRPGTWFSKFTTWKIASNFPQPKIRKLENGTWKSNPHLLRFRFYKRFCPGTDLRRLVACTCLWLGDKDDGTEGRITTPQEE